MTEQQLTTCHQRFETGFRFTEGSMAGECENLCEWFSTWQDAYDCAMQAITRAYEKHGEILEGYVFDRMAHTGAEDCRYFDRDGGVTEITYKEPA